MVPFGCRALDAKPGPGAARRLNLGAPAGDHGLEHRQAPVPRLYRTATLRQAGEFGH
ncbi:hypothetical protein N658DRAFT_494914 [Parathielavia hyrcaniae]|uniref:Uncharacterized protein n=1 Tax=Parathielavia hyrcaniae TaxID=113614 RepID=A0AAN6Q3I8_9PEZI|nr:hypothetical protein N658DRAFT_494914 [Parathielavia hyrcaniae]